jgi:hypothetical protein
MGFDAGDSNLYRYVNNAPTDSTDPSGLLPISTRFDWYYYSYVGLNYLLSSVNVVGDFDVNAKNKNEVDVARVPEVTENETTSGTAGMLGRPVLVAFNTIGGGKGFTVSIAVSSNYTPNGFFTTVGLHATAIAATAGGLGMLGGPKVAGSAALAGGGLGVVTGTTHYLVDFSDWNSTMTMSYKVFAKAGRIFTSDENCTITDPGNRLVACVAASYNYAPELWNKLSDGRSTLYWSRNLKDLGGGRQNWLRSDIGPQYGLKKSDK